MELLDQLEQRIGALLSRVDALAAENAALKEGRERDLSSLEESIQRLQQDLERERERNATALKRIEALVERIKEQTDQE